MQIKNTWLGNTQEVNINNRHAELVSASSRYETKECLIDNNKTVKLHGHEPVEFHGDGYQTRASVQGLSNFNTPSPAPTGHPLPQGARETCCSLPPWRGKAECASTGMRGIAACGFTLIELLVVVLIIGILSAVALPQYNKVVAKARATEIISFVDAYKKGLTSYLLEHDVEGIEDVFNIDSCENMNVYVNFAVDLMPFFSKMCASAQVRSMCYPGPVCGMGASFPNENAPDWEINVTMDSDGWSHSCQYNKNNSMAKAICKSLEQNGQWESSIFEW